ncbi:MAG: CIA30 family protein [Treponema sp.]|nr:CIA30 family protein [Treponema sp.]
MKKTTVVLLALLGTLCVLALSCASTGGAKSNAVEMAGASWDWVVNGDEDNGGTSTITMTEGTEEGVPSYSFEGAITNEYQYGFVNVKLYPDPDTLTMLQTATALSFRILGDGDRYTVKITTSNVEDYAYYEYTFDTVDGAPVTVIVPVTYLMQPSWGQYKKFNQELAQFVEFQTTRNGSPGPYSFKLWDFKLYSGGVPVEKPSSKKAAAPAAAAKGIGGDLGAFSIKLNDNFQYGDGYQAAYTDKRLFNGHRIVPGETYTLKITYTASRDLEDSLMIGLVDTTPQASYWRALSWEGDEDMATIDASKAGQEVSATITFKTTAEATGISGAANALVFITKGEGRPGIPNSGKQRAVTLNFTEFVFTEVK